MANAGQFTPDNQPENRGRKPGSKNKDTRDWSALQDAMLEKYFVAGADGALSTFDRWLRDMPEDKAAGHMVKLLLNKLGKKLDVSISAADGEWTISRISKDEKPAENGPEELEDGSEENGED